jgi:hypothetical protein
MDVTLLKVCHEHCIHSLLHWAITTFVVMAIFRALWSHTGGVGRDITIIQQELTEHTTKVGAQGIDRESNNMDKLTEVKLSKDEIKEEKEETSNLLEETSQSRGHEVTKGDMSILPEEGPKGQSDADTSLPLEEEGKIQAEEAILSGLLGDGQVQ